MDLASHAVGDTPTISDRSSAKQDASGNAQPTLRTLINGYLEDYALHEFRSMNTARPRAEHLAAYFGEGRLVTTISTASIREYQQHRRQAGAAAATVNRETSALSRMFRLSVQLGILNSMPVFPNRLAENGPRQGFFEHAEYLKVRSHLPRPYQDFLDFAYYSGWRKHEVWDLRWDEIDREGGVIRLPPHRSKTRTGRVLPISTPLAAVLKHRSAVRKGNILVFGRDNVTVRAWRRAWPDACRKAGVPGRVLHDCRRTAARNLVRAGIPERVAMTLTGHKTRCVFDRYNIVNERELADAGEQLARYLADKKAQSRRSGRSPKVQQGGGRGSAVR
jgi:integrase